MSEKKEIVIGDPIINNTGNAESEESTNGSGAVVSVNKQSITLQPVQLPKLKIITPFAFISYRKNDTLDEANKIYDHLVKGLGSDCVKIDAETLTFGGEWEPELLKIIKASCVLVTLFGQDWDKQHDGKIDWPREELRMALENDISIMPVLVNRKDFPDEKILGVELKGVQKFHALPMEKLLGDKNGSSILIESIRSKIFCVENKLRSKAENLPEFQTELRAAKRWNRIANFFNSMVFAWKVMMPFMKTGMIIILALTVLYFAWKWIFANPKMFAAICALIAFVVTVAIRAKKK